MGIKDYVLTNHALSRMKERNITKEDVAQVIVNPDSTHPGRHGEINAIKKIGGRKIRVVYSKEKDRVTIISAMTI